MTDAEREESRALSHRLRRIPPQFKHHLKSLDVPKRLWGTPAGLVVAFAHGLVVPQGKKAGEILRLRPFQIAFLEDIYNPRHPDGTRKRQTAIFSVGRRNGKTLLAAVILLVHLCGPMAIPNSTIVSAATTREQAGFVYRMAVQMIHATPSIGRDVKIIDSTKRMTTKSGIIYRALAADSGANLGAGIALSVYDELAQAPNRALYDAIQTSMGSEREPLMISISTQAPTDNHILSELIDYGLKIRDGVIEDDTHTVHLYTAPKDCDLMDKAAWRAANPALGDYRDQAEFATKMKQATQLPSLETSMRVLYLNQRVQQKGGLLSPSVWALGEAPVDMELFTSGRPVYAGLDLSGSTDLTAIVYGCEDDEGRVHLLPRVWAPAEGLLERAARDKAPYDVWQRMKFQDTEIDLLQTPPGTSIDYDFVAMKIAEDSKVMRIVRLSYDRWRINILKQAFARIGLYTVPLVEHGQGFKDMSPAVEEFEKLALAGNIVHGDHAPLRWCISNVVVERDPAGNRKPTKKDKDSIGRIDVAVAAIMMVGGMKANVSPIVDASMMIA